MSKQRTRSKQRTKSRTRSRSRSKTRTRSKTRSNSKTKTNQISKTVKAGSKRIPRSLGSGGEYDPTSRLKAYIDSVYAKYKTPANYKVLSDLEHAFNVRVRTTSYKVHEYPMLQITINNSSVTHKSAMGNDQRVLEACKLVKNTVDYAIKHKLPVPNTTLYLWVSDSYPYDLPDLDKKFPIMTYCNPRDMGYIIFPDATLTCLQMLKKYHGECNDFNTVKDLIIKNQVSEKIPIIYFKGTSTTVRQGRLREDFERLAKGSEDASISLDAWQKFEPLYGWSKYKWLLNLPGRFPWSNRLIWLFLTKSGVINVDLSITAATYKEEPYDIFINLIVEPNVDYVNIESKYTNRISSNTTPTSEDLTTQFKENKNIYDRVVSTVKSITDSQYYNMIESAYKKVNSINNDVIHQYVYDLIVANSKIITK